MSCLVVVIFFSSNRLINFQTNRHHVITSSSSSPSSSLKASNSFPSFPLCVLVSTNFTKEREASVYSGVDVNSEVPERSRKTFEMTFFDDFPKISRFFLRKILNDFFARYKYNAQYKAFRLI